MDKQDICVIFIYYIYLLIYLASPNKNTIFIHNT